MSQDSTPSLTRGTPGTDSVMLGATVVEPHMVPLPEDHEDFSLADLTQVTVNSPPSLLDRVAGEQDLVEFPTTEYANSLLGDSAPLSPSALFPDAALLPSELEAAHGANPTFASEGAEVAAEPMSRATSPVAPGLSQASSQAECTITGSTRGSSAAACLLPDTRQAQAAVSPDISPTPPLTTARVAGFPPSPARPLTSARGAGITTHGSRLTPARVGGIPLFTAPRPPSPRALGFPLLAGGVDAAAGLPAAAPPTPPRGRALAPLSEDTPCFPGTLGKTRRSGRGTIRLKTRRPLTT